MSGRGALFYYKSPRKGGVVVKGREERQGLDLRRWGSSVPARRHQCNNGSPQESNGTNKPMKGTQWYLRSIGSIAASSLHVFQPCPRELINSQQKCYKLLLEEITRHIEHPIHDNFR